MPHISVAYSHITGSASTIEAALAGDQATAEVVIRAVQLIVLGRDQHVYEWTDHTTLRLPTGEASAEAGLPGGLRRPAAGL